MQYALEPRFYNRARQGLDRPVECVLLLYRYHARLMFPRVLMEMDKLLSWHG